RLVNPIFGIGCPRHAVEPALYGRTKSRRIGDQAAQVNPTLRDDYIMSPRVDEADRAVRGGALHGCLGIRTKAPDALQTRSPRCSNRDDGQDARKAPFGPGLSIEVDPMPGLNQQPAEVRDIRLGASSRRVDALKVQRQVHDSNPPGGFRSTATGPASS